MCSCLSQPQMSSVLLVDSPAGVGYSYSENEDDYVTNDTSRVLDLYDFLSKVCDFYACFVTDINFFQTTEVIVFPVVF